MNTQQVFILLLGMRLGESITEGVVLQQQRSWVVIRGWQTWFRESMFGKGATTKVKKNYVTWLINYLWKFKIVVRNSDVVTAWAVLLATLPGVQ